MDILQSAEFRRVVQRWDKLKSILNEFDARTLDRFARSATTRRCWTWTPARSLSSAHALSAARAAASSAPTCGPTGRSGRRARALRGCSG